MTEKLSELVDGELAGGMDIRIDQLLVDTRQRQQWSRYHLIGATLRKEYSPLSGDFATRFEACLKDEPVVLCPRSHVPDAAMPAGTTPEAGVGLRVWKNLALAASLAAIAILSWHQFGNYAVDQPGINRVVQLQRGHWVGKPRAITGSDLDIYLFEHGQYASVSDLNGLMAYTKFVSYGAGD